MKSIYQTLMTIKKETACHSAGCLVLSVFLLILTGACSAPSDLVLNKEYQSVYLGNEGLGVFVERSAVDAETHERILEDLPSDGRMDPADIFYTWLGDTIDGIAQSLVKAPVQMVPEGNYTDLPMQEVTIGSDNRVMTIPKDGSSFFVPEGIRYLLVVKDIRLKSKSDFNKFGKDTDLRMEASLWLWDVEKQKVIQYGRTTGRGRIGIMFSTSQDHWVVATRGLIRSFIDQSPVRYRDPSKKTM